MRINFGVKPWCYPQPVFIVGTYDENGVPNAMNIAWAGITDDDEISMWVGNDRKTLANIKKTGDLTISMATEDFVVASDYVGIVSGNKEPEKFAKAGFTHEKAEFVNAPIIKELPMCIECKFRDFDPKTCIMRVEIVNISADSKIVTDGEIDMSKLKPIVFEPMKKAYWGIGELVDRAYITGKKLF